MTLCRPNAARRGGTTAFVIYCLGWLIASLCPPLIAPTAAAESAPAIGAIKKAAPPMWRVTDEDSEIWLVGTFHILPPGLEWRSAALDTAFEQAETYYFEVEADTAEAQQRTVQILMMKGFNPPGTTLSGLLDEPDAAKLAAVAHELGLPMAAIDPMRPWQAFLTISVQFIVKQGFDPGSGVDSVLMAEARKSGRMLRFFETIDQQLSFFTDLEPETEKNLLVFTLREWEDQKEDFDTLFAAWARGDAQAIDVLMNKSMRDVAPEIFDILIVDRNAAWAEKLAGVIENSGGKALVAVGAAHLVGEHSVPALLEAKGLKVERYGAGE
ncbi:MAG: TraB/GumN family protein [Parvularculaceae bacterium]